MSDNVLRLGVRYFALQIFQAIHWHGLLKTKLNKNGRYI